MEYSKAFTKLTFEEKLYLLHTWFPDTIVQLLDFIDQHITHLLGQIDFLKSNWGAEEIPADKWIELLRITQQHITENRTHMQQNPFDFIPPFSKGYFKAFFINCLETFNQREGVDKLFKAIALPFFFSQTIL